MGFAADGAGGGDLLFHLFDGRAVRQQKGQAHQVGGGDGVEASRNGLPSMGLREAGRVEVLLAGRAELLHDAVYGTVPVPVRPS